MDKVSKWSESNMDEKKKINWIVFVILFIFNVGIIIGFYYGDYNKTPDCDYVVDTKFISPCTDFYYPCISENWPNNPTNITCEDIEYIYSTDNYSVYMFDFSDHSITVNVSKRSDYNIDDIYNILYLSNRTTTHHISSINIMKYDDFGIGSRCSNFALGYVWPTRRGYYEIYILDDLTNTQLKEILIHEIGHIDYHYNNTLSEEYAYQYTFDFVEQYNAWDCCRATVGW